MSAPEPRFHKSQVASALLSNHQQSQYNCPGLNFPPRSFMMFFTLSFFISSRCCIHTAEQSIVSIFCWVPDRHTLPQVSITLGIGTAQANNPMPRAFISFAMILKSPEAEHSHIRLAMHQWCPNPVICLPVNQETQNGHRRKGHQ
jgi:hypothetical protein